MNQGKKYLLIITLLFVVTTLKAQNGIAFHHLKSATFQNTAYNPSFFPRVKLSVGLPAISGISIYANNRFTFSEAFTKNAKGENELNLQKIYSTLYNNNAVSVNARIDLFHIAFRNKKGDGFSIFANERVESDFTYPKTVAELAINGNAGVLGKTQDMSNLGLSATHYREFGIGYASTWPTNRNLNYGVRLKYLVGFFNLSTPAGFDFTVNTTNDNYFLNLELSKAIMRTSGVDFIQKNKDGNKTINYLTHNSNTGLGIDLGVNYWINENYNIAFSIVDLGYISWNEHIKNYQVNDTTINFEGVNLKDYLGKGKNFNSLGDSLIGKFDSIWHYNYDSYSTFTNPKFIATISYSPKIGIDFDATIAMKLVQNQLHMSYGLGVRKYIGPKFVVAASVTRLPKQLLSIGLAFAATAGPFQFYMAADQLTNIYSVPDIKYVDYRFGINILNIGSFNNTFGQKMEYNKNYFVERTRGIVTSRYLGSDVKVLGNEGITSIIKKQEPSSKINSVLFDGNKNSNFKRYTNAKKNKRYEKRIAKKQLKMTNRRERLLKKRAERKLRTKVPFKQKVRNLFKIDNK